MMDLIIHSKILEIRGVRVIPDFFLAELYQVETKALKQAVRRNIERFPPDFMFELTKEEADSLRSHWTSKLYLQKKWTSKLYLPKELSRNFV